MTVAPRPPPGYNSPIMAKQRKPRTPPPPAAPPPPVTEDTPLTNEELLFINEYMIDRKGGPAYQRLHPDCLSMRSACVIAHEMRTRLNVAAEIRERIRQHGVRCGVKADTVIQEIKRIGFSDILDLFDPNTNLLRAPRHIPLDLRRAIASVKVSRARVSTTRNRRTTTKVTESFVEYRFWNKLDALAKLSNRLGLNTEIPSIEQFLLMLPRPLAIQVRDALLKQPTKVPAASTNGKH